MPKKLTNIDIHFISLVKSGANKKEIIYKSGETKPPTIEKTIQINKIDKEQKRVYGIVYSPNENDTDEEFTTAEEIQKACDNFMKEGRTGKIDKQHDEVVGHGFVAECWITKEADPVFPDDPVGSWAVGIQIENNDTWEAVKKGEIKGLSMGGFAVKEEVKKSDEKSLIEKIVAAVKKAIQPVQIVEKDFNSENEFRVLRSMSWALQDSIDKTIGDESITDKKSAILRDIEQFKTAVENFSLDNINKSEEEDMKAEEVQAIVKTAVEEAVKPLNEKIEALEKSSKETSEKIETIAKATPGSSQGEEGNNGGQEPISKSSIFI